MGVVPVVVCDSVVRRVRRRCDLPLGAYVYLCHAVSLGYGAIQPIVLRPVQLGCDAVGRLPEPGYHTAGR